MMKHFGLHLVVLQRISGLVSYANAEFAEISVGS